MRSIIFVTGGARSGKSRYALQRAMALSGQRIFIATCPYLDDEMNQRIARHQAERETMNWQTVEEEINLGKVIAANPKVPILLIDCVSLWVNNLIYHQIANEESQMARIAADIVAQCQTHQQEGHLILVSNETGMGIVPDNALSRTYRDLVGRANQVFAEASKEAVFMVSGLPLSLKP